jgi:hypothetical protein
LPKILIGLEEVDNLARVHSPVRVPDLLELRERSEEFGSVHLLQLRTPSLAVAVLTRERTTVGDDQIGHLVKEAAPLVDAVDGVEREVDTAVDAPLAEVSVQRRVVAEPVEQVPKVAAIGTNLVGRYGGILPAVVAVRFGIGSGLDEQEPTTVGKQFNIVGMKPLVAAFV